MSHDGSPKLSVVSYMRVRRPWRITVGKDQIRKADRFDRPTFYKAEKSVPGIRISNQTTSISLNDYTTLWILEGGILSISHSNEG